MGLEVDGQGQKDISLKTDSFCCCLRYILLRVILRHILAQETLTYAWTDIFKLTNFTRLGPSHLVCMLIVLPTEKQAQTVNYNLDHH